MFYTPAAVGANADIAWFNWNQQQANLEKLSTLYLKENMKIKIILKSLLSSLLLPIISIITIFIVIYNSQILAENYKNSAFTSYIIWLSLLFIFLSAILNTTIILLLVKILEKYSELKNKLNIIVPASVFIVNFIFWIVIALLSSGKIYGLDIIAISIISILTLGNTIWIWFCFINHAKQINK